MAEWRNPVILFKDHLDNGVMDALLEEADKGKQINYLTLQLPVVRVVKGWCRWNNLFGKPAIITEGTSAAQALKNQYFVAMYLKLSSATKLMSDQFINEKRHHHLNGS